MHEVPTELGFSKARRTRVEVLVSKARRAFPRNPLCPCCRRVDPSTRWATRFDPKSHGIAIGKAKSNIQGLSKYPENGRKKKFSGMGWPGVENDATPCGIILRVTLAFLRPYKAKNRRKLGILGFPGFSLYFPMGAGQPYIGLFTLVC